MSVLQDVLLSWPELQTPSTAGAVVHASATCRYIVVHAAVLTPVVHTPIRYSGSAILVETQIRTGKRWD